MPKFINGIGHIFTVVKLPKLIKPSGHTGTRMRDVIERERERKCQRLVERRKRLEGEKNQLRLKSKMI